MPTLLQDIRYAFRMIAKSPAFALLAVLAFALGIGANTAIFSVVNAVLLRPLPYPHPEQLVLRRERLARPSGFESGSVSYMNYLDWRAAPRRYVDLELVRFPRDCDIFIPLADLRADHDILSRGNHAGFSALGRLKPGTRLKHAIADLDTIAADLGRRYPDSNTDRQVSAKQLLEFAVGEYRHLLYLLLAAVGCVLLIACANVANLQLARGIARGKELAVRAALGASRWHLARQVLVETGVIAILGGCLAALLALWSLDTIRAIAPASVPRFQETDVDPMVLLFTTGVVVIAAFLVGIWPALRVSNNVSMA